MVSSKSTPHVLWLFETLATGGVEKLLLELLGHVNGRFRFTPIVVLDEPRDLETNYREVGAEPIVLGARHELDLSWIPRLRNLVKLLSPSLAHLHNPYAGSGARLALHGLGVPTVYTEHSPWPTHHPIARAGNKLTFRKNHAVIAVSTPVKDSILASKWGRTAADRIHVIPNGVDIDQVIRDSSPGSKGVISEGPSFGTIGHLRRIKGVDVLIRASIQVAREVPGARGYVIGEGEDRSYLETLIREHEAPLDFLGMRKDARALARDLDVFVVPSRSEGHPLALLEAMALAKPIVATAVGGIPEILAHGVEAILVPPEDADALAAGIVQLLREPAKARALGSAARERVKLLSSAQTVESYARVYESILARDSA